MKNQLLLIVAIFTSIQLMAQAPESIQYQAVARDDAGNILENTELDVRFTIKSGDPQGSVTYQETHQAKTNQFGLFTLAIGQGHHLQGDFNTIAWGDAQHYLQIEVDDGSGYTNLGATQMLSVPYALYAKEAGNAGSNQYNAGSGIEINGNTIVNTGDTVAGDDITNQTNAAGDLSGKYPAPEVTAIQGLDVANAQPNSAEILKWDGNQWKPAVDADNQQLSLSGSDLSISGGNTVTLPNAGDITKVEAGKGLKGGGNKGDVTLNARTDSAMWNAHKVQDNFVAPDQPVDGQILKWSSNNNRWEPANDIGGGAGDNWGTQIVQSDNSLDGNGTSGDRLRIARQGASNDQVLKWNGNGWVPANDENTQYNGGTGIDVNGTTINNTGDVNAADDITNTTTASGDLSGVFPGPKVIAIQGFPVSNNNPGNGQVLKWDGNQWKPAKDIGIEYIGGKGIVISGDTIKNTITNLDDLEDVNTAGASSGQVLKWNGTNWVAGTDNTSSSSGGVTVTPRLSGDGSAGNPLDIAQQGANNGQVLKWNGNAWSPATDNGQSYSAGQGINISGGNVISNTGDLDANDDVVDTTQAGGDIYGTYSNLSIDTASLGSVEIIDHSIDSVDLKSNVLPNSLPPEGPAGGDLKGTYPNPGVDGLQGVPVYDTVPNSGQVLEYNGIQWIPATDDNTTYAAGTGLTLNGTTFDAQKDSALWNADQLQGNAISTNQPANNEVLKWNGSVWIPSTDNNTTYSGGNGININGTVIENTGDLNASNDITDTTTAGGDLKSTYPNPTVDGIQGTAVAPTNPANNEVLKYDGSQWIPASDENTTYTGGTAINISGNTINNTGDTDPADDITNSTSASGDLTGTYPAPTVAGIQSEPVSSASPNSGQILKYDGTQWMPGTDDTATYLAGDGLSLNGNIFHADSSQAIWNAGKLEGRTISSNAPSNNQVLKWDGSKWAPADDNGQTYTAGTGISISGGVITNTGDTDANDDITNTTSAGNDLSGTYPNPTVDGIQGNPVSATTPASGEVLKYDGSTWVPDADDTATYQAGTGLSLGGNTFNANANSALWNADKLQGHDVSINTPTQGKVLKWNNGSWEPMDDATTTDTSHWQKNVNGKIYTNKAVGIDRTYVNADFQVDEGSTVLFGADTAGFGDKLVWYGTKGGLRAGYTNSSNWDYDSIGAYSVAFGKNTTATALGSFAIGLETRAAAENTFAAGWGSQATAKRSAAFGYYTEVHSENSMAIGNQSKVSSSANNAFAGGFKSYVSDYYGFAYGNEDTVTAFGGFAMGKKNHVSNNYAAAIGESNEVTASTAMAFGFENEVNGVSSVAIGSQNLVNNLSSVAIGSDNSTEGFNGIAFGDQNYSGGTNTATLGAELYSNAAYATIIGRKNDTFSNVSSTSWQSSDPLFVIGNGDASSRSNALTMLKNGKTGLGVKHPEVRFHVKDSTEVLFGDSTAGAGSRMHWIADKGAMRFGGVVDEFGNESARWNSDSIGQYSTAFGNNTVANDAYTTAFGRGARATDNAATAWGNSTDATGKRSTAFGNMSKATYDNATAWGEEAEAKHTNTTAWGYRAVANGYAATAWGSNSEALASDATAWGSNTDALGNNSTAFGQQTKASINLSTAWGFYTEAEGYLATTWGEDSKAEGRSSTAFGDNTIAYSDVETVFGAYNTTYTPDDSANWDVDDRLFVVGNGTGTSARSNALTLMKNGNLSIGDTTPTTRMHVYDGKLRVEDPDNDAVSQFDFSTGKKGVLEFRENGSFQASLGYSDVAGQEYFYVYNGGNALVAKNGRVTIGSNNNPNYDLQLFSNSAAKPSSPDWTVASDRRLKTNIDTFADGMDVIRKIDPIWFTYNGKADMPQGERAVGATAQNIQNVAPYMVKPFEYEKEDGTTQKYLGVDYGALNFVMINAMKEQSKKIEQQDKKIDEQAEKIESMEKRISRLEQAIESMQSD